MPPKRTSNRAAMAKTPDSGGSTEKNGTNNKKKNHKTKTSNTPSIPHPAPAAATNAVVEDTDDPTSSQSYPFTTSPSTRQTKTHIFFHGGILSNWHLKSPNFSGERCFEIMIPRLDELGIGHPPMDALSTVLMSEHLFNCGEQWMMGCKGWLFEIGDENDNDGDGDGLVARLRVDLGCEESRDGVLGWREYRDLKSKLMDGIVDKEWKVDNGDGNGVVYTRMGKVWDSTVCRVLRAKTPKEQKDFGRLAAGFDVDIWREASVPSTVAACVARAEVDARLRYGYLHCGERKFVEGAKSDCVWGVGIRWNDPHIENEALWRGENRLGKCHDEAARLIRIMFGETSTS